MCVCLFLMCHFKYNHLCAYIAYLAAHYRLIALALNDAIKKSQTNPRDREMEYREEICSSFLTVRKFIELVFVMNHACATMRANYFLCSA